MLHNAAARAMKEWIILLHGIVHGSEDVSSEIFITVHKALIRMNNCIKDMLAINSRLVPSIVPLHLLDRGQNTIRRLPYRSLHPQRQREACAIHGLQIPADPTQILAGSFAQSALTRRTCCVRLCVYTKSGSEGLYFAYAQIHSNGKCGA